MDLRTSVDPACAQDLFDSARNAAAKGQAQFSTPPEAARLLCSLLPAVRPVVADLNCGPGHLLAAAAHGHPRAADIQLFGCDIQGRSQKAEDRSQEGRINPPFQFVQADVTKFFPLLRAVDWRCPVFTLNPPWDLHWHREQKSEFRSQNSEAGSHEAVSAAPRLRGDLSGLAQSELPAVRTAFAAHDGRTARDTIDSTVATLMMALDRLTEDGEGLLIANHATMLRLLGEPGVVSDKLRVEGSVSTPHLPAPHSALLDHVWLWLVFEGNLCMKPEARSQKAEAPDSVSRLPDPDSFRTAVLFFARGHTSGPGQVTPLRLADLSPARAAALRTRRTGRAPSTYGWYDHRDAAKLWTAAADEWHARRRPRPAWNLWLEFGSRSSGLGGGFICTHLNLYDEKAQRLDKATIARLHALNGKRPMDLVLMRAERDDLLWACGLRESSKFQVPSSKSPFKVAPALIEAVQQAITDYHAARAPLYPLPKIQRLGYLDEEDSIRCVEDFSGVPSSEFQVPSSRNSPTHNSHPTQLPNSQLITFRRGRSYPLKSETVTVTWRESKPNLSGEEEELELTGQELVLSVQDDHGQWHAFADARHLGQLSTQATRNSQLPRWHPLPLLVAHFEIPDVPDVATVRPAEYQRHLRTLQELEALCP